MSKDKKIKKMIKEATRPNISFDEFCIKNNIVIELQEKPQINSRASKFVRIFAPVAAALVLMMGLLIPNIFWVADDDGIIKPPPVIEELKKYGENDVSSKSKTLEQIAQDNRIALFDFSLAEEIGLTYSIHPKEDADMLLGYFIKDILYGFTENNNFYAYKFTYIIRNYENYEFHELDMFSNLEYAFEKDGIEYSYRLENSYNNDGMALINFSKADIDYFIILQAFEGRIEINTENTNIFILNAL